MYVDSRQLCNGLGGWTDWGYIMNFETFFEKATRDERDRVKAPYEYQVRLAQDGLPDVLHVPTGAGKTAAAVLPWIYRRQENVPGTPHWLVFVLPQRTLVEQTRDEIKTWLGNLASNVSLHVLMGGEDGGEWKSEPARERIFVGTQDMVLSRLLMRGYAEGRFAWPMSFGLLHAGAQFVFDEVQLMGPGLPTSLQLQGLRESLGTAMPCRSMWMSATLDVATLRTVDFDRRLTVVEISDTDRIGGLKTRLNATRRIVALDLDEVDARRYPRRLAERVVAEHRPGTRTLVVLNTVDRARQVYDAIAAGEPKAAVELLHSRYRPKDRQDRTDSALAEPGTNGTIVVSTQVLEAGVDITSTTLFTEAAPWSSIVQRAGRCNRDGKAGDARLFWTTPPSGKNRALPYEAAELAHTAEALTALEGQPLTSTGLAKHTADVVKPVHPILRRRDLLGLFDTAPDLNGNDIDVGPFIRDSADRTMSVAWRDEPTEGADEPAVAAEALCPAPLADVRSMLRNPARGRIFDQVTGEWRPARPEDVRPTAVIVLDAARGGYDPDRGFDPASKSPVQPISPPAREPDSTDTDPNSMGSRRWVPLAQHLEDTDRAATELLTALGSEVDLTEAQREAIVLAARYHDLGKAHPTFVDSLARANKTSPMPSRKAWAKSPGNARLRHQPPHFRHELVSALLLLDRDTGLLDGTEEPDLVAYLALAHHGKVRVTVRGKPDERADTILGVRHGTSTLDTGLPGGGTLSGREISLDLTRMGAGSLTSRALRLRDRDDLGPFRLAFCEAIVRVADWAASTDGAKS